MKLKEWQFPDSIDTRESDYLYLNPSTIIGAGNGLYTAISIYDNERIAIFKGEQLTPKEATFRTANKQDSYFMNTPSGKIFDTMNTPCYAKYANDAEGYGAKQFKNNATITVDEKNNICLVATKDIKIGEEIFCGYGKKYWIHFKKTLNKASL